MVLTDDTAGQLQLHGAKVFSFAIGQGMAHVVDLAKINEGLIVKARVVIVGFQEIRDDHPYWPSCVRVSLFRLLKMFPGKNWFVGTPVPKSDASGSELRELLAMSHFLNKLTRVNKNVVHCKAGLMFGQDSAALDKWFKKDKLNNQGLKTLKRLFKDKVRSNRWLR